VPLVVGKAGWGGEGALVSGVVGVEWVGGVGVVVGLSGFAGDVDVVECASEGEKGGRDAVADAHALAEGAVAVPVLAAWGG
jgi:hypothetical protein